MTEQQRENTTQSTVKADCNKIRKKSLTIKANRKGRHVMPLLSFLRVILIPLYWCLKPYRFYGKAKIRDGACVYMGNHYTIFDPIYPASTTWEGIHYVSKRELFSKPVLGWLLKLVKAIPANRDGNDARVMIDCLKCLKNGEKVALYPEGTRNKTEQELLPFHHGAASMAIKAKVPLIPIVLYTKPRFFRMTHVVVGEPIELTEYYDRKMSLDDVLEADEKLRQRILDIKREHTAFLENKKKGRH